MLFQALKATGTKPEDAAFVGDTVFDMEMARSAKLQAIGVGWGYHGAQQLISAGAKRWFMMLLNSARHRGHLESIILRRCCWNDSSLQKLRLKVLSRFDVRI